MRLHFYILLAFLLIVSICNSAPVDKESKDQVESCPICLDELDSIPETRDLQRQWFRSKLHKNVTFFHAPKRSLISLLTRDKTTYRDSHCRHRIHKCCAETMTRKYWQESFNRTGHDTFDSALRCPFCREHFTDRSMRRVVFRTGWDIMMEQMKGINDKKQEDRCPLCSKQLEPIPENPELQKQWFRYANLRNLTFFHTPRRSLFNKLLDDETPYRSCHRAHKSCTEKMVKEAVDNQATVKCPVCSDICSDPSVRRIIRRSRWNNFFETLPNDIDEDHAYLH